MPVRFYRGTGVGRRLFIWGLTWTGIRKRLCWFLLLKRGRNRMRWRFGLSGAIRIIFIIDNYPAAVICCIVTMLCWGSWANTQKLAASHWRFELFYWDYVLGILLCSLILAFTLGSTGNGGRSFMADISQADFSNIGSAIVGGVVFNAANILLG